MDAAAGGQNVLFEKGGATALALSYWSYGVSTESEGSWLGPLPVSTAKADAARTPSTEETADSLEPTLAAPDARTVEDREAQQALAASLAEIIDDILRSRQFAVRGIPEWLRIRPPNPAPLVEHPVTTEAIANRLRAELARAKVGPDAQARATKPWIDRMLRFVGHAESAADSAASAAERKKPAN
jgi:hypothetical protein